MKFFEELKRRNVIRVCLAYMVASWLLIQVAETVFPLFGFDDTPARLAVIILGIGLIPVLILAWVFEVTPEGIKHERDVDRSKSVTPETGQKLNRAIIGILVVALGYFIVDKFVLAPGREAPLHQETATTTAGEALDSSTDAKSIAVLPFQNMSGDPANEPFTLGIHDDLLTHLSRIKSLKTISRTSVLQYRGTTKTIPQIAAELGAKNILEGGIQRLGNRVRINLQLIDADTDEHLWAEIYDRELTADNLFDVQGEIATQVAKSLRATLLPVEQTALKARPTHSMEAYDLYLLGRHHWNQRSAESIEKARGFFTQAIEIDPQYVLAYSGLADSYNLLVSYGNMTGGQAYPRAEESINKAMSLDDSLSEVWASRGALLLAQEKFPEAAKALVRAIELDQRNSSAWLWYANTLLSMRRYDEHLAALETAIALEPMSQPVNNNLANTYQRRGDFDRSQQHFDRLLDIKGQGWEKYRIAKVSSYFWSGQLARAVEDAMRILASNPVDVQAMIWLIDAYLAFGDLEMAETWVERLTALDPATPWAREIFEARGDYDGAIEFLEETRLKWEVPDNSWFWLLNFRYAYLAGEIESAKSYFENYRNIAKRFDEISPGDSWQRDELRIAEFLIHHSDQPELGEKMLNEALAALQRLNGVGFNHPGTYYGLASAWALKGEHEEALSALDMAVTNGFSERLAITTEPALNPLRQDPRFIEITDRMEQQIATQKQQLAAIQLAPYQPLSLREPVEVPRELLEKYAGYYTEGSFVIQFQVDENGRLIARTPGMPDMPTLASAQDKFYAENAPGYGVQFILNEEGEVSHALARGGQGQQRFKPVDAPPEPIELDREALQRFVGVYSAQGVREASGGEAETDIWVVKIHLDEQDRAFIEYENGTPTEIIPFSEKEFFMPGFIHRFRFEMNPINGSVESLVQLRDGLEVEYRPE